MINIYAKILSKILINQTQDNIKRIIQPSWLCPRGANLASNMQINNVMQVI